MERWAGKVAVVTGAGSGIGAGVTKKFLEHGLKVVGVDLNIKPLEDKLKATPALKGRLFPRKLDVTDEDALVAAFEDISKTLGPIQALVNCAGVLANTGLVDGDAKQWRRTMDVNVIGYCLTTREAVKSMTSKGLTGHIFYINSVQGHQVVPYPNSNLYPASKHAVTAITETLRQEFNHLGLKIKVTSISPGAVNTALRGVATGDDRAAAMEKEPLLEPEDIADAIAYALSTPEHVQIHQLTIRPVGGFF